MVIAIILILFAVALFLIFHDDHDRSYTRNEPKSGRENGRKSVYQKSTAPRRNAPAPQRTAQTNAPKPAPNPVMGGSWTNGSSPASHSRNTHRLHPA